MLTLPAPLRLQKLSALVVGVVVALWLTHAFWLARRIQPLQGLPPFHKPEQPRHPIDDLREQAKEELAAWVYKQSYTVEAAERAYMTRRGRRPPPGFDQWFRFAYKHDALIIEDFFDRIYDDLNPFWALTPLELRQYAGAFPFRLSIRNHTVIKHTDEDRPWMNLWGDEIGHIAHILPDLDIPINIMDESRIVVPWETISDYMRAEAKSRSIIPASQAIREYNTTVVANGTKLTEFDWRFDGSLPYWNHIVRGCHPESPARDGYVPVTDFRPPPPLHATKPVGSHEGYVRNWTFAKSPCENPSLQALHGTFVEPISLSTTDKLIPLFGGSKLPVNNEILLPPAMYWTNDESFSGGAGHGGPWAQKTNKVMWRGDASGGRNRKDNWTRFQRHRFLAMTNGTTVGRVERKEIEPPNFVLPDPDAYPLAVTEGNGLSAWLKDVTDTGFIDLICFPNVNRPFCEYTDPWFRANPRKPMAEQFANKYLPDIDGNSFSGRYRSFLGSTSLPIKATIYDEWHDSRLMPWVHFVPMDNTFIDIYGILEYFIGSNTRAGHDHIAEEIAMNGFNWAAKVLRKEDMLIYVLRLLLEYARLCDDEREKLAWSSQL